MKKFLGFLMVLSLFCVGKVYSYTEVMDVRVSSPVITEYGVTASTTAKIVFSTNTIRIKITIYNNGTTGILDGSNIVFINPSSSTLSTDALNKPSAIALGVGDSYVLNRYQTEFFARGSSGAGNNMILVEEEYMYDQRIHGR